tara:strand:- start:187 stop:345 length:159 start_codon:yes stop_codon:yes gene_type:complete
MKAGQRIWQYIKFFLLTLITLGFYPIYFWITRQYEVVELLTEIRDELKKEKE